MAGDHAPFDRLDGGIGLNICSGDPTDYRVRCTHPMVATHRMAIPILMYHVIAVAPPGSQPAAVGRAEDLRPTDELPCQPRLPRISLQQAWDYWTAHPCPAGRSSSPSTMASPATTGRSAQSSPGTAGPERSTSSAPTSTRAAGASAQEDPRTDRIRLGDRLTDADPPRTHQPLPIAPVSRCRFPRLASLLVRRTSQILLYPPGIYDSRVIAAVHSAGDLAATTTELRARNPLTPYSLDRSASTPATASGASPPTSAPSATHMNSYSAPRRAATSAPARAAVTTAPDESQTLSRVT